MGNNGSENRRLHTHTQTTDVMVMMMIEVSGSTNNISFKEGRYGNSEN